MARSLPILGQTIILFIVSEGALHFEMTFTGGPSSLSLSLLFPIRKTRSPPTSYFIQINIPDRVQELERQAMKIHYELEAAEDAVSPSDDLGYRGSAADNSMRHSFVVEVKNIHPVSSLLETPPSLRQYYSTAL